MFFDKRVRSSMSRTAITMSRLLGKRKNNNNNNNSNNDKS